MCKKLILKPVDSANRQAAEQLSLKKSQDGFVEPVSVCLKEADDNEAWRPVCIYEGEVMIGFAMYGLWEAGTKNERVWFDRFLIDGVFQGRGFGRRAFKLVMDTIINKYQCRRMYLSVYENNKTAIALYESFGFKFNGELDGRGELVMVWENK